MKLKWEDYNIEEHECLDRWMDRDYSPNSELIYNFAIGNLSSISEEVEYANFEREEGLAAGRDLPTAIKVVKHNDEVVAVVFVRCTPAFNLSGKRMFYGSINPIIVNPTLLGQGYGKAIIGDLIKKADKITGVKIDVLTASVDRKNERSLRLIRGQGFFENMESPYNIIYFKKPIDREKYTRKKNLKSANESKVSNEEKE